MPQPNVPAAPEKHIAESTVRRLSLYLRVFEQAALRGQQTISSDALAVGAPGTDMSSGAAYVFQ